MMETVIIGLVGTIFFFCWIMVKLADGKDQQIAHYKSQSNGWKLKYSKAALLSGVSKENPNGK